MAFFFDNAFDLGVLNLPFIPKVVESIQSTKCVTIDVADPQTSPGSRDITRPQIVNWVDIENWSASGFPAVIHSARKAFDQRSLSNGKRLRSAESSSTSSAMTFRTRPGEGSALVTSARSPQLLILCERSLTQFRLHLGLFSIATIEFLF
jgi:hypothetical protein